MSEMIERVARRIDEHLRDVVEPNELIWTRPGGPSRLAVNIAQAVAGEVTSDIISWLDFQIEHGHAPDGQKLEMDPMYAEGRRGAFSSTLSLVKRLSKTSAG
jgi:hypothetical protein